MDVFILFDVLQINKKDEIPLFIVYSCTIMEEKRITFMCDTLLRIEMKI